MKSLQGRHNGPQRDWQPSGTLQMHSAIVRQKWDGGGGLTASAVTVVPVMPALFSAKVRECRWRAQAHC